MNLRDYIERMKMWIDKQHFIMRHYKFALGIFLIITVALLGIGIFYPHEEENVHISLDQSNGRDGNQNERGSEKLSNETTHGNRTGKEKNYFKDESDIKMLLQVHDELIFEVKDEAIEKYLGKIEDIMENTIVFKDVRLEANGASAKNWGELK